MMNTNTSDTTRRRPRGRFLWPALALLAALLAGCAGTDQAQLARFLAAAKHPTRAGEYRVMPPDVLRITARPTEEYMGLRVRVGPDGKAFLPLVGTFDLADKTTTQIAAELTDVLRDYYQDVQVTVSVEQYRSQHFYVFGEVRRPGVYPWHGNDTILSALAAAGPTRLAMPEEIYLVRGLDPLPDKGGIEVDGDGNLKKDVEKLTINLWEMARDGEASANVMLANNDVIYVPANPPAKIGLTLRNLLLPVDPALEVMRAPYDTMDASDRDGGYHGYE